MEVKRNILIVGGGISGLALLHYLTIKYYFDDTVSIKLLEKNNRPGGTIHTIHKDGYCFESGPNGFLDNKSTTLKFIRDVAAEIHLCPAASAAKIRFIAFQKALHAIPITPKDFLAFKLLNPLDKLRILSEIFLPRGQNLDESVYDFGCRRLGKRFADLFLDPMVSGIYGGNVREICLRAAFPRMAELEKKYRSLFKAMMHLKKKGGAPQGTLTSFHQGMAQLTDIIAERYKKHITLNSKITTISRNGSQYIVYSKGTHYTADELFVCTPAYGAANLLKNLDPDLSQALNRITYAPIAVVGLGFLTHDFQHTPQGFGYLNPSSEKRNALGVLFDSNIFPGRAPEGHIFLRVMIGGTRFAQVLEHSKEQIIQMAIEEVRSHFPSRAKPHKIFIQCWPQAIPQYDQTYLKVRGDIETRLKNWPNLCLNSNYWGGISFNDSIETARKLSHV